MTNQFIIARMNSKSVHAVDGTGDVVQRHPLIGPCAWRGEDLRRDDSWICEFGARDAGEIDAAVSRALERKTSWPTLRREDFVLPNLSSRLAEMGTVLERGRGMVLIRGFPMAAYSSEQLRLAFMGVGLHLGIPVYQNAQGERIREIRDEGADRGARYGEVRSAEGGFLSSRARVASTGELRFHTDRTDLVALLCLQPARAGGVSRIASSVAVHNAMLHRRPDLLACLYQPYPRSRFGEESKENDAYYLLPVMATRDGFFTSHYSRTYIEAAQLIEGAPRLTDSQWQAIDSLAEIAAELCLEMRFEPGDIQILNSHVTYHARSAYEDDGEPARRRLLYRLWLCPPNNRPLPKDHAVLWGKTEPGELRGGIRQVA
ncbi:MAG TPA: TauD/TfdA family dioxygenase [Gammaproteobacteria bacterium]